MPPPTWTPHMQCSTCLPSMHLVDATATAQTWLPAACAATGLSEKATMMSRFAPHRMLLTAPVLQCLILGPPTNG